MLQAGAGKRALDRYPDTLHAGRIEEPHPAHGLMQFPSGPFLLPELGSWGHE